MPSHQPHCPLPHSRQRLTKQLAHKHHWTSRTGMNSGSALIPPNGSNLLPNIQPRHGQLVHLPTRAEAQAVLTLADAYVLEVPVKGANDILSDLDRVIEKDKSINLSHLRRFARQGNLPRYVADRQRAGKSNDHNVIDKLCGAINIVDLSKVGNDETTKPDFRDVREDELFLLIGLTKLVNLSIIAPVLKHHGATKNIIRTRVPISPPMNPNLAKEWSDLYWPTQYRKSTPLGPHPTVVRQGTEAIAACAGYWMAQAMNIGNYGFTAKLGPPVGALIVDSKGPLAPAPVAIAADARYGMRKGSCKATDNVMNHAVMRVIGQIGRKRMSLANPPRESPKGGVVLDYPILKVEQDVFDTHVLPPGGYLCTGLDIYLTHEPCVMCAQAILHSRFDKVIFRHRMSRTGAATPERTGSKNAGLGYGLFWRPELNWRLLVWEWTEKWIDRDARVPAVMHS